MDNKFINFIKLGGSLITDKSKPMTLCPEVVAQIAQELSEIYKKRRDLTWIIGNGAGSFGHYMVHKTNYLSDPVNIKSITAVRRSVAKLNNHIVAALVQKNIPAVSLPPSTFMHQTKTELICDIKPLEKLLANSQMPIIYGDVIDDETKGSRIISTEEALDTIARALIKQKHKISSLVFVTSVDGVLDNKGKILKIFKKEDRLHTHTNNDFDVTGGMAQKVEWGFRALDYTPNVYIINGKIKNNLTKALNHQQTGTRLVG